MFYGTTDDDVRCAIQERERLCQRIQLERKACRARDEARLELRSHAPATSGLRGRVVSIMRELGTAHLW